MYQKVKAFLDFFATNEFAFITWKTCYKWFKFKRVVVIKISSKNTNTNFLKKSLKIWFIKPWNVTGTLVRPKGIIKNSKWPECVLNAVLKTSSSARVVDSLIPRHMWQWFFRTSPFWLNFLAPWGGVFMINEVKFGELVTKALWRQFCPSLKGGNGGKKGSKGMIWLCLMLLA